jgi:predicted RNA-binding protein with PUA-like domain
MRDMKVGDRGFFYHSNAGVAAGIVGTVTVVREAYPDPSCLDPKSKYYDPKSSQDNPRWSMVDVRLDERWARPVLLSQLRNIASAAGVEVGGAAGRRGGGGEEEETGLLSEEQTRAIAGMKLLQRGMRLSVQPLTLPEWDAVNALSRAREGRYESNKN